jgi:hypothetical protein
VVSELRLCEQLGKQALLPPVFLLRVDLRWARACWVETLLPRVLAVRELPRLDGWQ